MHGQHLTKLLAGLSEVNCSRIWHLLVLSRDYVVHPQLDGELCMDCNHLPQSNVIGPGIPLPGGGKHVGGDVEVDKVTARITHAAVGVLESQEGEHVQRVAAAAKSVGVVGVDDVVDHGPGVVSEHAVGTVHQEVLQLDGQTRQIHTGDAKDGSLVDCRLEHFLLPLGAFMLTRVEIGVGHGVTVQTTNHKQCTG
jgi:hypothetical protein